MKGTVLKQKKSPSTPPGPGIASAKVTGTSSTTLEEALGGVFGWGLGGGASRLPSLLGSIVLLPGRKMAVEFERWKQSKNDGAFACVST